MKIGILLEYNCNFLLYSVLVCFLFIFIGWILEIYKNICILYINVNYIIFVIGIIKC